MYCFGRVRGFHHHLPRAGNTVHACTAPTCVSQAEYSYHFHPQHTSALLRVQGGSFTSPKLATRCTHAPPLPVCTRQSIHITSLHSTRMYYFGCKGVPSLPPSWQHSARMHRPCPHNAGKVFMSLPATAHACTASGARGVHHFPRAGNTVHACTDPARI